MKLTPQHYKAVEYLATGMNVKSVAEELGIAAETVSRWRADFNFQAALNVILEDAQQTAKDRLRHLAGVALDTIEAVLTDSEAPAKDRLTAALKVLELTKVTPDRIGSSNAQALRTQKEQDDLLESYGM